MKSNHEFNFFSKMHQPVFGDEPKGKFPRSMATSPVDLLSKGSPNNSITKTVELAI